MRIGLQGVYRRGIVHNAFLVKPLGIFQRRKPAGLPIGIAMFHAEIIIAYVPPEVIKRTHQLRSEEHTSELQSLMRTSYAVFCSQKKTKNPTSQLQHLQRHAQQRLR